MHGLPSVRHKVKDEEKVCAPCSNHPPCPHTRTHTHTYTLRRRLTTSCGVAASRWMPFHRRPCLAFSLSLAQYLPNEECVWDSLHAFPLATFTPSLWLPRVPLQTLLEEGCHSTTESVLDSLVKTILSQNTTDVQSSKGFKALKAAYPTWESVRHVRTCLRYFAAASSLHPPGPRNPKMEKKKTPAFQYTLLALAERDRHARFEE